MLQGGIYVLQVMDWYSSTFSLMIIAFSECLIIGWLYGRTFRFLRTRYYFVLSLKQLEHIYKVKNVKWFTFSFAFFGSFSSLNYAITLHSMDKRMVNIMKVFIERNNLQVGLIRYRTFFWLYSRLLLWSDEFNAISSTDWAPKYAPAMLAYSLGGSRCSCTARGRRTPW